MPIGLWATALLGLPTATPVGAQSLIAITGDETTCDCGFALEHIVTLGDEEGPGMLLGEVREVQVDSRGVYYVLAWNEHQINRFTPEGRALTPIIAKGQGPGEALETSHFMLVADSVVTFDPGNARMTVFTSDGELVRTVRTSGLVFDAEYYPGRGILINERGTDAETFGVPLHLVDFDGERVRAFGGEGMVRLDAGGMWHRIIDRVSNSVWAAWEDQYVLEQWSLDGTPLNRLARDVDWFEPRLHREWGGPDEPQEPWISDIKVDRDGNVRVLILRGGPHWAERIGEPVPRPFGEPVYPAYPGIGLFESVLEVIDPVQGTLIAKAAFDEELHKFLDEDRLFSYQVDQYGNPTISIWRLVKGSSPPNTSSLKARR